MLSQGLLTGETSDFPVVSLACGDKKLTLVVDEAVGGEQFEGVDLEQDSVEQKVVSCRTELGFVTQTRLRELLRKAARHQVQHMTTSLYSVTQFVEHHSAFWICFLAFSTETCFTETSHW